MLKWCVFTVCKHVYDTGSGGGGGAKWGRRADPMFIGDRLRSMQLVRIINEPQPINSTSVRVTWQLRRIPAHYIDGYRVSYRVLPDYDQSFRNVEDDASFMEDTVLGGGHGPRRIGDDPCHRRPAEVHGVWDFRSAVLPRYRGTAEQRNTSPHGWRW